MNKNLRIMERDKKVMREIDRWRVCLGRHIRELAGFTGERACDRRLRKLIDAGYITRMKVLYGIPSVYQTTNQAKYIEPTLSKPDKLRLEQLKHDITVLDTAIYLHKEIRIPFENITTEKELHRQDGFGIRKHRPEFIYQHEGKTNCVEVELTLKATDRLIEIIKDDFLEYDTQIWIVPDIKCKIANILKANKAKYPNIEIKEIKEVERHE